MENNDCRRRESAPGKRRVNCIKESNLPHCHHRLMPEQGQPLPSDYGTGGPKSSTLPASVIQIEELFCPAKVANDVKLADRFSFGCGLGISRSGKTRALAR